MVPTVCRGFSEEYGSWKIIWMSRRSGRIRLADRWVMSRPSKTIRPPVGSSSRVSSRPVVVLPQPDSPTSAECLAAPDGEGQPVDRLHRADLALQQTPASPGSA